MKKHVVNFTVEINAPAKKVWQALTRPDLVKQYFFGTDLETDWRPGSPMFFRGVWEGKPYEDKGQVLDVIPEKRVTYTYWSYLSGTPDIPENYRTITYDLETRGDHTLLTLSQDAADEKAKTQSEKNWRLVFDGLKKLVEADGRR